MFLFFCWRCLVVLVSPFSFIFIRFLCSFSCLSLSLSLSTSRPLDLSAAAGAMAGFELGSGMFSNGNKPEQDAFDLREINLGWVD